MNGSSTPYDWSNGPVPAAQLASITRVTVQVTGSSAKPDFRQNYAQNTYTTDVTSLRNVPGGLGGGSSVTTYGVSGFVFVDANKNGVKDGAEVGESNATVSCGSFSTVTGSSGAFTLSMPAGTYTLRHYPATGFGALQNPDSVVVTVPPVTAHSFPDSVRQGGTINVFAFNDANSNGTQDAGELGQQDIHVSVAGLNAYTDAAGDATFWVPVGAYSVAVLPDSFTTTTTNPVLGSMANGGSASINFGVVDNPTGTFSGTVFRDNNSNGTKDAGENGITNVWVGVTTDGGYTVQGFAYTDASGNYTISVPANNPPHTTPYSLMVIPPTGFYPTTTTSINNLWVSVGGTVSSQNFGMGTFSVITLTANRVLCLGSRDLVEKDWPGNSTGKRVIDQDIVLGSDANGADQISAWFNQYSASPLFNSSPDYTRAAPNSVLSMALDTLGS